MTDAEHTATASDRTGTGLEGLHFPPGFRWGSATSSYQIEGAVHADGRSPSIWDTFSHTPGKVQRGDTGDVACDHYHRLDADLDVMAELGLHVYRFSVAWPRVIPDGRGAVNAAGLDFYSRLVDGLLARGIEPLMTLYHWDLPQVLEDAGGWRERSTVDAFAEYAAVAAGALGDRVRHVTTFNEPWCTAFLGHASGEHAPGRTDQVEALRVAHHLNVAHAAGAAILRDTLPAGAQISLSLNLAQLYPASGDSADIEATTHVDLIANRIFLDPALGHGYPPELIEQTPWCDWSFVVDGDEQLLQRNLDELGLNYYTPGYVAAPGSSTAVAAARRVPWPGTDRAVTLVPAGPVTSMNWPIVPTAFTDLLVRVGRDAPGVPLWVHENGAAFADEIDANGVIDDRARIDYVRSHIAAVHDAIEQGVEVRGYMLWSLLDNFEWAWGYTQRFGIVHVDFDSLARTPKASARWYRDHIGAQPTHDPAGGPAS